MKKFLGLFLLTFIIYYQYPTSTVQSDLRSKAVKHICINEEGVYGSQRKMDPCSRTMFGVDIFVPHENLIKIESENIN